MCYLNLFFLLSLKLFYFIKCRQLIPVQAQLDPQTNTLLYNGKTYKISELITLSEQNPSENEVQKFFMAKKKN